MNDDSAKFKLLTASAAIQDLSDIMLFFQLITNCMKQINIDTNTDNLGQFATLCLHCMQLVSTAVVLILHTVLRMVFYI